MRTLSDAINFVQMMQVEHFESRHDPGCCDQVYEEGYAQALIDVIEWLYDLMREPTDLRED